MVGRIVDLVCYVRCEDGRAMRTRMMAGRERFLFPERLEILNELVLL